MIAWERARTKAETGLKVFGCCADPPCAEDQEGASGIDFIHAMRDAFASSGSSYLDNLNAASKAAMPASERLGI